MFPSKKWFEKFMEIANSSEELGDLGRDLKGDFLCTMVADDELIKDLKDEHFLRNILSGLSMIPKKDRELFEGTSLDDIFREILGAPFKELERISVEEALEKASGLSLNDLKGASVNVWLDFHRGRIRSFTPVAPSQHYNADFKISGPYSAWKKAGTGEVNVPELIGKGDLEFKGKWAPIMGNLAVFDKLLNLFSSVDSG